MNKRKRLIQNIAGCQINEYEQKMDEDLAPYDWDKIYLSFKEEMTMFQNVVYLVKNTPEEKMPVIAGCEPSQYLPVMKIIERIHDSIKRLEEVPRQSSHVAKTAPPINTAVKEFAKSQGIDLVGFTTLENAWVFPCSNHWTYPQRYQPITYAYVISLGMEMSHDVLNINHFPDLETLFEALQTYAKLGEAVEKITEFIRGLGYEARGHHPYAGDFLYSAHAVKAGLGQLGANGLVLTKKYGPRQRFAAITTNAPIHITEPCDLGVDDLCTKCMRCVNTCPVKALPPFKVNWRGTLKWKLNSRRCWPYFTANNGCGLCLVICPWNKKDTWYHRIVSEGVQRSGLFRWLILKIDDFFYWREASTNPRRDVPRPQAGPLSFAAMLEVIGKERLDKKHS